MEAINEGDAFHYVRNEKHLWIVISDPVRDPANVLLVNMTSHRSDKDQSCLLYPGDHECVDHKSCINYEDAHVTTLDHLHHLCSTDSIIFSEQISTELLSRIRVSAGNSSRMKIGHWQILVDQGLVDC
jgi:hypothetical protein